MQSIFLFLDIEGFAGEKNAEVSGRGEELKECVT